MRKAVAKAKQKASFVDKRFVQVCHPIGESRSFRKPLQVVV